MVTADKSAAQPLPLRDRTGNAEPPPKPAQPKMLKGIAADLRTDKQQQQVQTMFQQVRRHFHRTGMIKEEQAERLFRAWKRDLLASWLKCVNIAEMEARARGDEAPGDDAVEIKCKPIHTVLRLAGDDDADAIPVDIARFTALANVYLVTHGVGPSMNGLTVTAWGDGDAAGEGEVLDAASEVDRQLVKLAPEQLVLAADRFEKQLHQ